MSPSPAVRPEAPYRRRVIATGGFAAFVLYVVGAPIFNNRIEDDLERRVPAALAAAGHAGVTVKFSGQDGRIDCVAPLADPEAAIDLAYGVHGVHSIELDRSCRVATAPGGDPGTAPTVATGVTVPASAAPATTEPTDPSTTSTPTSVVTFETVGDVIDGDAMFSSLALLLADSELLTPLADPDGGPYTVFAPANSAFAALPAATESLLASDAEIREQTLNRHVVEGALTLDDLRALDGATVTTLDGTELAVAADGAAVMVGAATLIGDPVEAIEATTGLVYAIDRVLVPDGVPGAPSGAPVAATLERGVVTLTGTVSSDADRAALAGAAAAAVGDGNVADQLEVSADAGAPSEVIADVASLIAAFDLDLVAGQAGFDGARLYLTGNYPDPEGMAAANAAARAVGAVTDLAPRPAATGDQAARLETELNEYVAANPILFQPGSSVLDDSAVAIIDHLAVELRQFGGLTVVVEGHTDSDGDPAANRTLSEQRAAVVRQALVDRGVADGSVTAVGFGATEPVLVNGLEDKSASRRVEFEITAQ